MPSLVRCPHRLSAPTDFRKWMSWIVVSLYQAQLSCAVAGRVAAHHGCSIRRCQLRSSCSVLVDIPKDIQLASGDLEPWFTTVENEVTFPRRS
ncbi:hypothetical protein ACVXHA_12110 [Escherichia coli]